MTRIALLLLAGLALAAPAAARERSWQESRIVRDADLDLGSAAGVAALDRRIDRAIRALCGPIGRYAPHRIDELRRCRAETLAAVQPQRAAAIATARNRALHLAGSGR